MLTGWNITTDNLDVVPALEALVKMREFYAQRELDVFKDAVSISGVSFAYVMRGSIDRGANLWGPNKEAYKKLTELAKQKYARTSMMIVKCAKKSSVLTLTRFTCTR